MLAAADEQDQPSAVSEAAKKAVKLIPAEVITGYTGLISLVPALRWEWLHPWVYGLCVVLGIVATPIYLSRVADADKPKRRFIVTATLAFPFWAYFTSGQQVAPQLYDVALASILLALFSFISSLIPMTK
jgi:hypothetical protein